MRRTTLAALAAVLLAGPAAAEPAFGPEAQLYHFEHRSWLADGALFCMTANCPNEAMFYLVADPAAGHLDVYGVTSELTADEEPVPGQRCTIIAPFLAGPVYGTAPALLYPARVLSPDGILQGRLFVAARLDGLTKTPGASLRYTFLDPEELSDPDQRALAVQAAGGDPAATGFADWPAAWESLAALAETTLDGLKEKDLLTHLHLLRVTSPAERDAALGIALTLDDDGLPETPVTPANCLPAGFTAGPATP